jgi:PAS domain S-box-containing protein
MPSSDFFELAVSRSPCGVVVCDAEGRIVFSNETTERMFGYDTGELAGSPIDTLVPITLDESHAARRGQFAPGDGRSMVPGRHVQGRRKNGTTFPVEVGLTTTRHQQRKMLLATILDMSARRDLEHRLAATIVESNAFDLAIAEIAATFVTTPDAALDGTIEESQRRLSELLDVDHSSLWQQVDGDDDLAYTHVWARKEEYRPSRTAAERASGAFPWVLAELRAGRTVSFTSLDEVPSAVDRATFERIGTRSNASIPLVVDGLTVGGLTFGTIERERSWSEHTLDRLRLVATVFAHSLAHRRAQRALEAALGELKTLRDRLADENVQLRREVRTLRAPRLIAAESTAVKDVLLQIEQVAPTTATVLMLGETGSGKEMFASAIHELSPRRHKPMVRVNCAAIPTALIESELFGRERGAYTGALSRQIGRFEVADGSTIFLDEIGDLPLEVQVKLLRVLQERVIERLGSSQSIKVDVRVIAASHRDLEQAVTDHTVREDLYYRLNVFPIRIPPLRERVEDIPALAWAFIDEFSKALGKRIESLSKASLQALQAYSWPGNVRELRNVIERAVIIANGPRLVVEMPRSGGAAQRNSLRLVDVDVEHIRAVLEKTGWRVRGRGGAAELLGMKPTTLESRMAKLGIARADRRSYRLTG